MAVNLIEYANRTDQTFSDGCTYRWSGLTCHVQGTPTGNHNATLWNGPITDSPFEAGKTYIIKYSSINLEFRVYFYRDLAQTDRIETWQTKTDRNFTMPSDCVSIIIRLRMLAGYTYNETVSPEVYLATTDVDADCEMMMSVIGYPNSWFYPKWVQFASGALWDGQSCSEIACCISYMAGNLSKIYVSNYAQGLADLFRANGRFGSTPSRGAFIWFDYDGDGVPDHTGRVYEILQDGTIHTVEGNVGGLVRELYYAPGTSYIYGYGYPNYDNDPMINPDDPTPPKFTYLPYFRHKRRERSN